MRKVFPSPSKPAASLVLKVVHHHRIDLGLAIWSRVMIMVVVVAGYLRPSSLPRLLNFPVSRPRQ